MFKSFARVAVLLLCVASSSAFGQAKGLWEEYAKLIESREAVGVLGPTLFGDSVNYYTGALSFSATDVAVPGNNRLPVSVTRTMGVGHAKGSAARDYPFADWDMQLPNISGVFAASTGWVTSGTVYERCSKPGPPPSIVFATQDFPASAYWSGTNMTLLGGGGGELLAAGRSGGEIPAAATGRTRPGTGGPYYWLTSDFTYVSCVPTSNNAGEGFLAITSDGTKYSFDWMATFAERDIKKARRGNNITGEDIVQRNRYALYATRVEDRFGNWVRYSYDNAASEPVHVTSIESSDGRLITFTYNAKNHIRSVKAGDQTWYYEYGAAINRWGVEMTSETLTGVILPDQSRWTIDFRTLAAATLWYFDREPGVPHRNCMDPGDVDDSPRAGTITHPSGAVGVFTVAATRLSRTNVLAMCSNVTVSEPYTAMNTWHHSTPPNDPNDDTAYYPIAWDAYALTQKQISGPGLATTAWNYEYFSDISWFFDPSGGGLPVCTAGDCIAPQCTSDDCAGHMVATICGPNSEFTRYTFGNSYRYNEGKLLTVEAGLSAGGPGCTASNILRTSVTGYQLAQSGQPFPTPIGVSPQLRSGAGFSSEYVRPQTTSATTQDGVTFNSVINSFDRFAHPLKVTKSNTLGFSKTETTTYSDNLDSWVIGQTATVADGSTGKVMSRTDYHPATALPIRNYSFGVLQNTLTYNTDGTLATVTDGRNKTTTLSNWYRGIPRNIHYPATPDSPSGATESAMVDQHGWVTSVTDENPFTTSYSYDAMGRLASIQHPTGDSTTWADTTRSFVPVADVEYGLSAGHWKQSVQTGTGLTTTFYDAQWRPVLTLTQDTNNNATKSFVVNRYDSQGRLVFTSYPVANLGTINDTLQGITTVYDGLGRVTDAIQDSELGPLTTHTDYLPGFQTRVTNPLGHQTTTSYQVFDAPSTNAPLNIAAPESVTTTITRDVFGKPLTVTRSGPGD